MFYLLKAQHKSLRTVCSVMSR